MLDFEIVKKVKRQQFLEQTPLFQELISAKINDINNLAREG